MIELAKIPEMTLKEPVASDFEKMTVATLHKVLSNLGLKISKSARKDNVIRQMINEWSAKIASGASSTSSALTTKGNERGDCEGEW